MTSYSESPLRPQGSPWVGLKTRSGKLDDGSGQMDEAINVIINRADLLEKRKGLVRAIEEQFSGPVCGLFKYTDHCGTERLLVADQEQISIRTPFDVPVFTIADCYPNDSFSPEGSAPDPDIWRNTNRYVIASDALTLQTTSPDDDNVTSDITSAMRWFKESCSKGIQVQVQYDFATGTNVTQKITLALRGSQDFTGTIVLGQLVFREGSTYQVRLFKRNAAGTFSDLLRQDVTGTESGFFTFQYNFETRKPGFQVSVTGGTISGLVESPEPLSGVEDADLGLTSGLGLTQTGGLAGNSFRIRVVSGGSV